MPKIIQLSPHIANLIAAGEVVERPASVVKELLENAVDAGASQVTLEIRDGGMTFLRVTDNGCGMSAEDAHTAFLRHATSKLRSAEDLTAIASRMLAEVTKRISALGIGIRFSGRVAEHLAQAGADPRYGARPLRRTFVRLVEDSFSEELLSGRIRPGDSVEAVWESGAVRYLCRATAEK